MIHLLCLLAGFLVLTILTEGSYGSGNTRIHLKYSLMK